MWGWCTSNSVDRLALNVARCDQHLGFRRVHQPGRLAKRSSAARSRTYPLWVALAEREEGTGQLSPSLLVGSAKGPRPSTCRAGNPVNRTPPDVPAPRHCSGRHRAPRRAAGLDRPPHPDLVGVQDGRRRVAAGTGTHRRRGPWVGARFLPGPIHSSSHNRRGAAIRFVRRSPPGAADASEAAQRRGRPGSP